MNVRFALIAAFALAGVSTCASNASSTSRGTRGSTSSSSSNNQEIGTAFPRFVDANYNVALDPRPARLENAGSKHVPEFLMLEWYRENATYKDIMTDVQSLIIYLKKEIDVYIYIYTHQNK